VTSRFTIRVIAVLLLLTVSFVFVSPLINLEPTALRAWQAARLLIASVVLSAFLFAGWNVTCSRFFHVLSEIEPALVPLQDLTCTRLC